MSSLTAGDGARRSSQHEKEEETKGEPANTRAAVGVVTVSDEHRLAFIQHVALMGQVCVVLSSLLCTEAGAKAVCDMQMSAAMREVYTWLSERYRAALDEARERWNGVADDRPKEEGHGVPAAVGRDDEGARETGQTPKATAWVDNTAAESLQRVVGLMSKLMTTLSAQTPHTKSSR